MTLAPPAARRRTQRRASLIISTNPFVPQEKADAIHSGPSDSKHVIAGSKKEWNAGGVAADTFGAKATRASALRAFSRHVESDLSYPRKDKSTTPVKTGSYGRSQVFLRARKTLGESAEGGEGKALVPLML